MKKTCVICGITKDIKSFRKGATYKDGRSPRCGSCRHSSDKPDTLKDKMYFWSYGAKKRNIQWDLTLDDLENLPKICHYTGVDLVLTPNQENTISLDRLDSSRGYTKDNIVFCCADINKMKLEFNKDYFIRMCHRVSGFNAS